VRSVFSRPAQNVKTGVLGIFQGAVNHGKYALHPIAIRFVTVGR